MGKDGNVNRPIIGGNVGCPGKPSHCEVEERVRSWDKRERVVAKSSCADLMMFHRTGRGWLVKAVVKSILVTPSPSFAEKLLRSSQDETSKPLIYRLGDWAEQVEKRITKIYH